ncbi:phosphoribosyltransferase [Fodinicurvata fenggangensis]|uniref:phosphoribosyltransferase n=1 Tax=Fodinicurvata fenggangensis TaxID=1121830 RepID=UPI00047E9027|nr:phosphoribosyltransferase family protein [Fodinicurvata fenggangensis]
MFRDREEAGTRLAEALQDLQGQDVVVLALPRGGVPVAAVIAAALKAPLGVLMVRKIGVPRQPELAVAALVDAAGEQDFGEQSGDEAANLQLLRNEALIRQLGIPEAHIEAEATRAGEEIARRRALYGGQGWRGRLEGRQVILVDDGVATGLTAMAALQALRVRKPARLVLAVPVAAPDVAAELARLVDRTVILEQPQDLGAVSLWYRRFDQVDDETVGRLLQAADRRLSGDDTAG